MCQTSNISTPKCRVKFEFRAHLPPYSTRTSLHWTISMKLANSIPIIHLQSNLDRVVYRVFSLSRDRQNHKPFSELSQEIVIL